jgi:hypothetical protein
MALIADPIPPGRPCRRWDCASRRQRLRTQDRDRERVVAEVLQCDRLDLLGRNLLQPADLHVGEIGRKAGVHERAHFHGLREHGVALEDLGSHRLQPGALELLGRDALAGDALHLCAQCNFQVLRLAARRRRAGQHEQAGAAIDRVVAGTRRHRELLPAHQLARQPRRLAAVQRRREHPQCVCIVIALRIAQHRHVPAEQHIGQLRRRAYLDPAHATLRGLCMRLAQRQRPRCESAEPALRFREHGLRIHVPDHYQGRIVRRVPAAIPGARVLHRHVEQVLHPADHRCPVRVCDIGGRKERLVQQRARLVFRAQPALLHHHPHLARELLRVEQQVLHAVRLEPHGERELRAVQLLVIGRRILARERVLAPSGARDRARELPGRKRRGALEHHVLEQVRYARAAADFIHAACVVPEHGNHDGGAAVFLEQHAQAVGQPVLMDLRQGRTGEAGQRDGACAGREVTAEREHRLLELSVSRACDAGLGSRGMLAARLARGWDTHEYVGFPQG